MRENRTCSLRGGRRLACKRASSDPTLATRTLAQEGSWSLEAASFVAAVAVGCGAQLLHSRLGLGTNALAAAGCIPMVPGLFAAQGILGLYALTAPRPNDPAGTVVTSMEFTLRVIFTIGAIGTGLSIATYILPSRDEGELGEKR